ncbi:MAG: SpoIIIAH-like family protein [Clostridia bacterium]|nr:SpoIIIAH-like family protein [Clostridia bacterium]
MHQRRKVIFLSLAVILVLAFFINGLMERQRMELIERVSSETVLEPKILGEATLVSAPGEEEEEVSVAVGAVSNGYFADARINRQKARDAAVELLQGIVKDSDADEESKRDAASELGLIASILAKESNMESLIKAKGFYDAVAVIGESDVTVVVQSDGLSSAQVSQIKEIVLSECEVGAEAIKIIEVK